MIAPEAIRSAYPLAAVLTRQGKALFVAPETLLAGLVEAARPCDLECDGVEIASVAPEVAIEEASSLESYDGVNDFSVAMNEAEAVASKSVYYVLDMARNVVLPEVRTVVEKTLAYADARRQGRDNPFTIRSHFPDEVFQSAELNQQLDGYSNSVMRNIEPVRLTAQWSEAALNTGIPSLDAQIASYLSTRTEAAKNCWERYFGNVPGKYRSQMMADDLTDHDSALVVYLGANQLLGSEDVPDGLSVDLPTYRSYLARVREQAGALLGYRLKMDRAKVAAKQLVLDAPRKRNAGDKLSGEIVVNGDVYNEWLAQGGSPEALYGAVQNDHDLGFAGTLANRQDLAEGWTRFATARFAQAKLGYQADIIAGLREALVELAQTKLTEGATLSPSFYSLLDERLKAFLLKDVSELYSVARSAVCRLFYPSTDAEKILESMDAVMAGRQDLTPREAALLVMIEYVTDWVADSIGVTAHAVAA